MSAGGYVRDVDLNLPDGTVHAVVATGRSSVSPDVWYATMNGVIGYGTSQAGAVAACLERREAASGRYP